MDREVWPDEHVNSLADRYLFASLDVDQDFDAKSRYHVPAIPTIVVADPRGHAVLDHTGFINAAQVLDI
jgi:hypothetical protein